MKNQLLKYFTISLLSLLFVFQLVALETKYPFDNELDAKKFYTLIQNIRCVVCQNQSIAESNAPLAADLKNFVYQEVKNQVSVGDIEDSLKKRYGEFVSFKPSFNFTNLLLWIFPWGILIVAMWVFYKFSSGKRMSL